jgi:hypothetical protein
LPTTDRLIGTEVAEAEKLFSAFLSKEKNCGVHMKHTDDRMNG